MEKRQDGSQGFEDLVEIRCCLCNCKMMVDAKAAKPPKPGMVPYCQPCNVEVMRYRVERKQERQPKTFSVGR